MIVFKKTMVAALEAAKDSYSQQLWEMASQYGGALDRVTALQKQLEAWVLNRHGDITPEQAAQMFYAQDDRWQAAFFNSMQDQVIAFHAAQPPARPGTISFGPGVPAGEGQWYHVSQHLTDSGFETLEAMYKHAKSRRSQAAA